MKKPPTNLLDLMSKSDLAKVDAHVKQVEASRALLITREWLALAEMGYYFGWQAVKDVLDDYITIEQMNMFIQGARKLHSAQVYDTAIANVAGHSTKKGTFESLMKHYVDDMKEVN